NGGRVVHSVPAVRCRVCCGHSPLASRTRFWRLGAHLRVDGRGCVRYREVEMKTWPSLLVCLLCFCSCGDRIGRDREARLQPVIQYMDAFVKEHHRLPTQDEFQVGTKVMDRMLILRDRTDKYAASKGAKSETDYMVGCWRADWFHY